jgi:GAF domain
MDTHSILEKQVAPKTASPNLASSGMGPQSGAAAAPARARETLRFPGEDGGKSLTEMAQRDLDATLQLLAERARYITGASGSAVALRQGQTMICCASAGPSAPELGAHLEIESGLSGESVRTRQTLHCEDAENDPRVNRESCRAFGIASVVVMPLIRGEEVYGVFELLADRPHAFEERDFVALQRLAEMIQTAVEHADAARRAEKELGGTRQPVPAVVQSKPEAAPQIAGPVTTPEPGTRTKSESAPQVEPGLAKSPVLGKPAEAKLHEEEPFLTGPIAPGSVGTCEVCAFPVSPGRRLCLDCEAAAPNLIPDGSAYEFPADLADSNASWARSHAYLIATVVIVAATIVLVIWRF